MDAIEIKNVSKRLGDFAIQDLSLVLPQGSICGLVGENGAGKTTAIRLIMDALRPDSGEIRVLGVDNRGPEFQRVKEDVGIVLDESHFPETLNARQVGLIMADTYRRWDAAAYDEFLKRFGLPLKKAFKDYSRGMTMKLGIAVALSHSPKLLILDEATSGLDPIVRDEILEIFSEFTRDETRSILISSHIVSDLEKLCDYIAFLHRGRLRFCMEKDALRDEYGIVSCNKARLSELPQGAVLGAEESPYGVRALVKRKLVPASLPVERPSLEDIILFLVKGEKQG
ncbi:ABC transporter ATP-binding protein [Oscillibacter sp.]|uniref:ABC transporter ATP-binding protein n=1 Tax=Oscillibacter sp. TaxID=1945593 RepID=UPI00289D1B16|nr:ABC transporter ATP-binding protein [Oscillibacter sp.]